MTEEEKKTLLEEGDTQAPTGEAEEAPAEPEIPQAEPEEVPAGEPSEPMPEPVPEPEPEPVPAPRTFTQEEVNAIVGKVRQEARAKAREEYAAELRDKYGVDADSEIDDLIGNGQRFDALNGEYESQSATLSDLKAENSLLKSGVPQDKFDDVKAILAYKGLEVTPENIALEAATHPEWASAQEPTPPQPINPAMAPAPKQAQARPAPSIVQKLGGEPRGMPQGEDEAKAEFMRKMFGR